VTRPAYVVTPVADRPQDPCPRCKQVGRPVERITLKALLRPPGLVRLSAAHHRFCPTSDCPVVYFGREESFERDDITVPVFQKEVPGARLVCYCLSVTEAEIRREILESGRSAAADQIRTLVNAGRCACEVKNPQGSCCLGNVAAVTKTVHDKAQGDAKPTDPPVPTRRAAP